MNHTAETMFLTAMNLLAAKHNVKITIDYDASTINFDGAPEDELALVDEIDMTYKKYLVELNNHELKDLP